MELKAQTVGMLVHDLKGPIGNLMMFSEMLNSLLHSNEHSAQETWVSQYIHLISTKYLDQLQNWSDFYFIRENKILHVQTRFSFSELLSEVIKSNQLLTEKKKIHIGIDSEKDFFVVADKDQIRRVIDNLFQIIILLVSENSEIKARVEYKGDYHFSLKINGLSDADKSLFEALYIQPLSIIDEDFFTKGLLKSTGISLAFSYEAIHFLGGKTFVENENSQVVVGFTLPSAV